MSSLTAAFALLAPTMRAQHGLVTAAQAADLGVSSQQLSRLVVAGLLVRRDRGLYCCASAPQTWDQRAMERLLRCGSDAALSHGAAARVHGLEQTGVGRHPRLEIIVPRGARPRGVDSVGLHESAHLDLDRDVVSVGGMTVTSPAWTIGSLCTRWDLGRAERVVDAAVSNGHVRLDDLRALIERWWHTPGVVVLRAVLLRHLEEGRMTRSEAERLFLRILRDAGLPLPDANVRIVDAAGRVRYLDFAYRDLRIAIEIDVHRSHRTSLGRHLDGSRQNDLVPTWLPLRFDERDLRDHLYVAGQVERALRAATERSHRFAL